MRRLVGAVQELSLARTLDAVMQVTRRAARELTGADGATFVLRDEERCFYADEDAIGPLWKGQRFPITACISGWAMLNRQATVVEDIYNDPRIPVNAYRRTFVKSLVMVPIRVEAPIGAIGNYWAEPHRATAEEVELLQALANTTAVAIEDVQLYNDLERRVRERTRQLEAAYQELDTFSYSVSHDLITPLHQIGGFAGLLAQHCAGALDSKVTHYVDRIRDGTKNMSLLVHDLLRLSKFSRAEIKVEEVDLTAIAREAVDRIVASNPARHAEFKIADGLTATGDAGFLRVVIENLLGNAWKYTQTRDHAVIEFGATPEDSRIFFIRDNGVGFDMSDAQKLFAPFQRLHRGEDFSGHGVGLATVDRIIGRHGGRIWANAAVNCGATFFFTVGDDGR